MKLRHIEVFHAIYLAGSEKAAARALNVSQPGISKTLKHTEDLLGFKLFDRVKGRLIPSEKGTALFEQIEPVLNQLNELKSFASQLASDTGGHIRFAMTPAFGLEVGPKTLARFSTQHPNVTIEVETLHSSEITKALQRRSVDIGLVFGAPNIPGVVAKVIGNTSFVCLAPTEVRLPNTDKMAFGDFEGYPLIVLNEKSVLGRLLAKRLADAFVGDIKSRFIVDTYHIAKRLIQQKAGIAIVDEITAYSEGTGDVQIRDVVDSVDIEISVIMRANESLSDFHKDFIETLQQTLGAFLTRVRL